MRIPLLSRVSATSTFTRNFSSAREAYSGPCGCRGTKVVSGIFGGTLLLLPSTGFGGFSELPTVSGRELRAPLSEVLRSGSGRSDFWQASAARNRRSKLRTANFLRVFIKDRCLRLGYRRSWMAMMAYIPIYFRSPVKGWVCSGFILSHTPSFPYRFSYDRVGIREAYRLHAWSVPVDLRAAQP